MRTIAELFLGGTIQVEQRRVRRGRAILISDEMNTVALLFPRDNLRSLAAMDKVLSGLQELRAQLAVELHFRGSGGGEVGEQPRSPGPKET
jgi:hypothetical protein